MSNALTGLAGAVLGALAAGGIQLFLEFRRDRRQLQAAKRLVAGELLHQQLQMQSITALGRWPQLGADATYPTSAWTAYRATLAGKLDPALWEQLVRCYGGIEIDRQALTDAVNEENWEIAPRVIAGMNRTVETLRKLRLELFPQGGEWPVPMWSGREDTLGPEA